MSKSNIESDKKTIPPNNAANFAKFKTESIVTLLIKHDGIFVWKF
jgi:hypothetical protein